MPDDGLGGSVAASVRERIAILETMARASVRKSTGSSPRSNVCRANWMSGGDPKGWPRGSATP